MKPLIYISGPLTAPTRELEDMNVKAAMRAGIQVLGVGGLPLIPHLMNQLRFMDELHVLVTPDDIGQRGREYELFMEICMAKLRGCDAMLKIGDSVGANREEQCMIYELARPVFYNIHDLGLSIQTGQLRGEER